LSPEAIKEGFSALGLQSQGGHYVGAEKFAGTFERCSILKDVSVEYSRSAFAEEPT
jgi:hypothetical protein